MRYLQVLWKFNRKWRRHAWLSIHEETQKNKNSSWVLDVKLIAHEWRETFPKSRHSSKVLVFVSPVIWELSLNRVCTLQLFGYNPLFLCGRLVVFVVIWVGRKCSITLWFKLHLLGGWCPWAVIYQYKCVFPSFPLKCLGRLEGIRVG